MEKATAATLLRPHGPNTLTCVVTCACGRRGPGGRTGRRREGGGGPDAGGADAGGAGGGGAAMGVADVGGSLPGVPGGVVRGLAGVWLGRGAGEVLRVGAGTGEVAVSAVCVDAAGVLASEPELST